MAQTAQLSALTALTAQLIPGFAEVPAHIQDALVRISLQASQSVMSGTNLARAVEDGREEFEEMKENHQAMRELLGKQVVIRGVAKKPELNAQVGVAKEVSKEDPKRLVVELANKKRVSLKMDNLRLAEEIDLLPPPEAVKAALSDDSVDPDLISDVLKRAVGATGVTNEQTAALLAKQAERRKVVEVARSALGQHEDAPIPSTLTKQVELREALTGALKLAAGARLKEELMVSCRRKLAQLLEMQLGVGDDPAAMRDAIKTAKDVLPLLGGELGLQIDRRVAVVFTALDEAEKADELRKQREAEGLPAPMKPQEFYCPITTEVMREPVLAADGRTYERDAIEQWLASNSTSPMTREPMESTKLLPNLALKTLIREHEASVQAQLLATAEPLKAARMKSHARHLEEKSQLEERLADACAGMPPLPVPLPKLDLTGAITRVIETYVRQRTKPADGGEELQRAQERIAELELRVAELEAEIQVLHHAG